MAAVSKLDEAFFSSVLTSIFNSSSLCGGTFAGAASSTCLRLSSISLCIRTRGSCEIRTSSTSSGVVVGVNVVVVVVVNDFCFCVAAVVIKKSVMWLLTKASTKSLISVKFLKRAHRSFKSAKIVSMMLFLSNL